MARIYYLARKEMTIRQMIAAGRLTPKLRVHLEEAYSRHQALYPDDADTLRIKQMLTGKNQLGSDHKVLLEELFKYEIQEEEHPTGILDIRFPV